MFSNIELPLVEEVGLLLENARVDGGLDDGGRGDGRRLPVGRHVALDAVLLLIHTYVMLSMICSHFDHVI